MLKRRSKRVLNGLMTALLLSVCSPPLSAQFEAQEVETQEVDTLVLCSANLQAAMGPWLAHRQQQGHKVAIEIAKPSAAENKQRIIDYAENKQLKHVLIVGDSGDRWQDPRQLVPTNTVLAKVNVQFGSEPTIGSDNPYADLDGDAIPDLAIGRLTADTPQELSATIKRIIRYETLPAGQLWQRRINVVAGIGGFGRIVDAVVENVARQILTNLIPGGYETSMTYGSWTSPFCPDPRRFAETSIGRFNQGCLFWVYCGHGQPDQLDRVMLPDQSHPILDANNVHELNCQQGSPIALCLSCYTGAHDGRSDSLAELMMRQPGGPVAVVCGSRVTMPYAMSVLSVEMMNGYFRGDSQTIGELLLKSKRRMMLKPEKGDKYRQSLALLGSVLSPAGDMLEAECEEHLHLMQLIGDPLLRLKRPQGLDLALVPEAGAAQTRRSFVVGDRVKVRGQTDSPGAILVELAYQRGRSRHRPPARRQYDSSPTAFAEMQQDYARAHDCVCVRQLVQIAGGSFEADLEIPAGCAGACDVRAILLGAENVAIDSLPLTVKTLRVAEQESQAETRR